MKHPSYQKTNVPKLNCFFNVLKTSEFSRGDSRDCSGPRQENEMGLPGISPPLYCFYLTLHTHDKHLNVLALYSTY